ncbi:MAG: hypothetical protein WDO71_19150 [Bacteroidota bacterium]
MKTFHCSILNNHEALKKEQQEYKPVPVVRQVSNAIIQTNYVQIKQEIEDLINAEMERILSDPGMEGTVLKKN